MSVQIKPVVGVMKMLTVAILKEASPAPVRLVTKEMDSCVKVKQCHADACSCNHHYFVMPSTDLI